MSSSPSRMDPSVIHQLSARLRPLLERVGAETGLVISLGKATYTANNAVFAVEAAMRGNGGIVMNRQAEAFRDNAVQFGLHPNKTNQQKLKVIQQWLHWFDPKE